MSELIRDQHLFARELARRSFPSFLRKAYPWISGGELIQWNWHLDALAYWLERVMRGTCRRLLVTLPPRNLKSKTISIAWPAWVLGHDPTRNFVGVSYSNELSGKLGRDCLAILQSPWYRELFPATRISVKRSASHDFDTSRNGGRLSTSISGTLTGRGGDILILDDVLKPEEASSEVMREAVNDWYASTLSSRLNDKGSGAIIVVMQRLHQFDLAGMLLEAGSWDHLCLPAIAPEDELIPLTRGRVHERKAGDVLHPEREPLSVLLQLKGDMGSDRFTAQYLQNPVPAEGNLIKADWLKTYAEPLDPAGGYIVQSWDTANKENLTSAFSVCITALVRGKYVYLVDVFRKRLPFPELKKAALALALEHKCRDLLVEDQASGEQLIQELRVDRTPGLPVPVPRKPDSDKESRVHGISAMIEAGQLILPREAPWLAEFKAELLGFPNTRYKDQVDALSQLMSWVRDRCSLPRTTLLAGPELMFAEGPPRNGGRGLDQDYDYEDPFL